MMIVMTGGTQGLGRVAASHIRAGKSAIMGARGSGASQDNWQHRPLDLASLGSVREFVSGLPNEPITHLVLNAGGQRPDIAQRTEDGFESTFATNHLAHYLLLRLAMPRLAEGARIVITTSGTHDPAEKTGVPPPRHADAELLAHPENEPDADRSATVAGMRAYSASKLCNLMTALYLARSQEARAGGWSVFAYDPGLTPGTGLVRDQHWAVRKLVWPLLPIMIRFSNDMNTLEDAGRGLAELATSAQAPTGRTYAALRKGCLNWPDPSALALDEAAQNKLWVDSARLVGIG
ncbi:SDR family NAD(P)-dependent oxidoreductase [Qipengyuania qiaonensis]|uniref:SDR family NAD(P)-dependent oxidoreductase n=1 Tax=Qipengyuania qiaonensis TaxID=2867240 RepID=A0ABS7J2R6_9SPHN|nr:SDR family NAD(P)-dependent oxidoreductase [Qipengyuania qiaonensis]MBX7481614.1 SDR family NAD(P)-dependent oxidoreductase [Qipengyuania qiaonensis]